MLFSTFLIHDLTDAPGGQPVPGHPDIVRTFEINDRNISSSTDLLPKIFTIHSGRICVMLNLPALTPGGKVAHIETFSDICLAISFHYRYLLQKLSEPFIALSGDPEAIAAGMPIITERFRSQGFDRVHFHLPGGRAYSPAHADLRHSYLLSSGEELSREYGKILRDNVLATDLLFVKMERSADEFAVIRQLLEAENSFSAEMPKISGLMRQNKELKESRQHFIFQNSLLRERMESELKYRAFYSAPDSGYKKKVMEISDFYRTEYDILPLWYKRFGHIIKVLMGKRAFKSLFDDHVKKYKV